MPVVIVNMLSGRNAATKKALLKKVTDAVTAVLAVAPESVRGIIQEMPSEHYGIAGLPVEEFRARKTGQQKIPIKTMPANESLPMMAGRMPCAKNSFLFFSSSLELS
ncbi:MAG TPA: tautomerase family protein [Patescibacteria group bacterium]|nr:tautomerase family protein [Patescibacteria group bacterium]